MKNILIDTPGFLAISQQPGSFKIDLEPPEVFVDMDEVLADWYKKAREVLGPDLVNGGNDFDWAELHAACPDLYRRLDPMPDMKELWDYVKKYNPILLTAIPRRWSWPDVTAQKREWAYEHLGPSVEVRFGPHAIDKQYHCRKPNAILIDDNSKNIVQWISRGGIGIEHKSAADSIAQLKSYGY